MTARDQPRLRPLFSEFVTATRARRTLILQPRMGFCDPAKMRLGLFAVRATEVPAIGTVTLDSYTRLGDHERAARAAAAGTELNGYPLVAIGAAGTAAMLDGVQDEDFPVQIRHGCAQPERIFADMLASGVDATEGGPVSYCLPYSRIPLRVATRSWSESARLLARQPVTCHIESFGGCMLGQLCPPALLVALSVLECVFFAEHGIRSVSASYAQQTNAEQDSEALFALRRLCSEHLSGVDWHIVLYTYMGLFPESKAGARQLLMDSVRIAVRSGTERLVIKTTAEAHRIPSIGENVAALRLAHRTAVRTTPEAGPFRSALVDTETYLQARFLVNEVRNLAPTMAQALPLAFERGLLDVPYCMHPDNRNESRGVIDADGRLEWWDTGRMPLPASLGGRRAGGRVGADRLLADLAHHRHRLDHGLSITSAGGMT